MINIESQKRRKNTKLDRNSVGMFKAKVNKNMIHCVFILKAFGYFTIALTNNFVPISKTKSNPLIQYSVFMKKD